MGHDTPTEATGFTPSSGTQMTTLQRITDPTALESSKSRVYRTLKKKQAF